MKTVLDLVLHLDVHLRAFADQYGPWIYLLLFLIICGETGLIVLPFLPGDSLLFAVGGLAAQGILDIRILLPLLVVAGILGNTINYAIGAWIGPRVFHINDSPWFNPAYLRRAHLFFEKYGGRAIILARFAPVLRTFAPFVAGIARMDYRRYFLYNVLGTFAWIGSFLLGGYLLGNIPAVRRNFHILILLIIVVSMLPVAVEWWRARRESRSA